MKLLRGVICKNCLVQSDLIVARIVLTSWISNTGPSISHFSGLNVLLIDTCFQGHIRARGGGALHATFLMVNARAESEELMVAVARQNALVLTGGSI